MNLIYNINKHISIQSWVNKQGLLEWVISRLIILCCFIHLNVMINHFIWKKNILNKARYVM